MEPIDVVIVEDHTLVREGTRELLAQHPDLRVVGEADRGAGVPALVARLRPRVLVLDLRLPDTTGIALTETLAAQQPDVQVVILSAYDDEDYILAALRAGAKGYLLKNVRGQELARAVRAVAGGETVLQEELARKLAAYWRQTAVAAGQLSPREREVLCLLTEGRSNKEIARALTLSLRTVEGHLGHIFAKLGVRSRTEAALYAVSHHLCNAAERTPV